MRILVLSVLMNRRAVLFDFLEDLAFLFCGHAVKELNAAFGS